eukprot:11155859-Lingulodinium_polyedra.AAC.1
MLRNPRPIPHTPYYMIHSQNPVLRATQPMPRASCPVSSTPHAANCWQPWEWSKPIISQRTS